MSRDMQTQIHQDNDVVMGDIWQESEAGRLAREKKWNGQFYAKDEMDVDESEDEEMYEEDSDYEDLDAMTVEKSTGFSDTSSRTDSDDGTVTTPDFDNFKPGIMPPTASLPQLRPEALQRRKLTDTSTRLDTPPKSILAGFWARTKKAGRLTTRGMSPRPPLGQTLERQRNERRNHTVTGAVPLLGNPSVAAAPLGALPGAAALLPTLPVAKAPLGNHSVAGNAAPLLTLPAAGAVEYLGFPPLAAATLPALPVAGAAAPLGNPAVAGAAAPPILPVAGAAAPPGIIPIAGAPAALPPLGRIDAFNTTNGPMPAIVVLEELPAAVFGRILSEMKGELTVEKLKEVLRQTQAFLDDRESRNRDRMNLKVVFLGNKVRKVIQDDKLATEYIDPGAVPEHENCVFLNHGVPNDGRRRTYDAESEGLYSSRQFFIKGNSTFTKFYTNSGHMFKHITVLHLGWEPKNPTKELIFAIIANMSGLQRLVFHDYKDGGASSGVNHREIMEFFGPMFARVARIQLRDNRNSKAGVDSKKVADAIKVIKAKGQGVETDRAISTIETELAIRVKDLLLAKGFNVLP
ncbi:unnamed protein product [Zymoseptoria tritici ST99CH_1A5]|uniref:Uncharacterized protein n=1 Tax=Zymoseptoria tritici ST99CH_1A5 TaxID=1276529 RepID=A0A1Y6LKC4_ZYMTR|nr:unnamed protein product [Zymoseptoria tritici ST99CH_1A5]